MGYFAGLDVSLEETAICIVDDAGMHRARGARTPVNRKRWLRSSRRAE